MNEEDALLAAIRENPADDTARLVYADWLDEHGRGAQAAWVRAEVELQARVPGRRGFPGAEESARIKANTVAAWKNFDSSTLVDESVAGLSPHWHRGFVNRVAIEIDECLQRLPGALARHPIEYVDLNRGGDTVAVLRISRGSRAANTDLELAIVSGTPAELRDEEWSVQYDGADDILDPMNPILQKWPSRAAMVDGVSDWVVSQVE